MRDSVSCVYPQLYGLRAQYQHHPDYCMVAVNPRTPRCETGQHCCFAETSYDRCLHNATVHPVHPIEILISVCDNFI